MRRPLIPALLLLAPLAGCLTEDTPADPDLTAVAYAPALEVNLAASTRLPTGVYIRDLTVGTGATASLSGQIVQVRYTGWLPNGTQFDQNAAPAQPLGFTLGASQVIRGFEAGVVGMKAGGIRQVVIPPSQGYGWQQVGTIPAGSVTVFRITLLEVAGGA